MKKIFAMLLLVAVCYLCAVSYCVGYAVKQAQQPVIDLPEEWMEITKDKDFPDILVGHRSGDTLYLAFDN